LEGSDTRRERRELFSVQKGKSVNRGGKGRAASFYLLRKEEKGVSLFLYREGEEKKEKAPPLLRRGARQKKGFRPPNPHPPQPQHQNPNNPPPQKPNQDQRKKPPTYPGHSTPVGGGSRGAKPR